MMDEQDKTVKEQIDEANVKPTKTPKSPTKKPKTDDKPKASPFEEKAAITTRGEELKHYPGKVQLSNYSRNELITLFAETNDFITKQQEVRRRHVSAGNKDGLLEYQSDEDSDNNTVTYLTKDEAEVITYIRNSVNSLYPAINEEDFLFDGERITNQPIYTGHGSNTPIGIMTAKIGTIKDPVTQVRRRLGLSTPRNTPLWSSGFRVEINGPGTLELLNLETKILNEKIDMSYNTYGYALTSANIYMDRPIINFILESITTSTAGTTDPRKLMRLISLTDYDTLVLAMASSLYPDGYNLERKTIRVNDESGVQHTTINSSIRPWRMLAVKDSYFTDEEMARVAKQNGTIDLKTIKEHRLNLRRSVNRFVELNNGMFIKLQIPTLEEYLRIGLAWQSGLERRVKNLLDSDSSEDQRHIFLSRATEVARVMFLAHWIEGFYVREEGDVGDPEPIEGLVRLDPDISTSEAINEADDNIAKALEDITVNPKESEKLLESIEGFINKMRLTSAVLPREKGSQPKEGEHPVAITVNPVDLFFTLLRHKIQMAGGY